MTFFKYNHFKVKCYNSQFSGQFITFLKNCDNFTLVPYILGKIDETLTVLLSSDQHKQFMNMNAAFLKAVYAV